MFYYDKTLVFDPTGISGGVTAVKENVRETLRELSNILMCNHVKSTTLILNGNIWRYFAELHPLAELIRFSRVTCYIDGARYHPRADSDVYTDQFPNRLDIVFSQGYWCTKRALWMGLRCGDKARLYDWTTSMLINSFKAQKRYLGNLPCRFPHALTTSFTFPAQPRARSDPSKPDPEPHKPLTVFIGPGSVMYSYASAAASSRRTFTWNRWKRLSRRHMPGPRASQTAWVADTLLPSLVNYKQVLTVEETSLLTYQETVAAFSPPHLLPPVSTLDYDEGFGSWIGFAADELSVSRRLSCVHEEMLILQRNTALMTKYGVDNAHHPIKYRIGARGITMV